MTSRRQISNRFALAVAAGLLLWGGTAAAESGSDAFSAPGFYESQCAFCHGAAGKGDGAAASMLQPKPTSFADASYWDEADRAALAKVILEGKPGTAMVPFSGRVNAEQAAELVDYLRKLAPK